MIQSLTPELIAAGVTFLTLLIDALRRYHNDEEVRIYQLPWIEFRALFEFGRRLFFTIDRPDHPVLTTDKTLPQIKTELGKQGVKWRHRFAYVYEGEELNGYIYYYDPERDHPHRMIHLRVFDEGALREIQAHEEPHWYHHPIAHLRSNDMEFVPANEWAKRRLENAVPVGYPN